MTTIVAVKWNGVVAIAAESAVNAGAQRMNQAVHDKIIIAKGAALACAGEITHALALRECLPQIEQDWTDASAVYGTLLRLHARLKAHHYLLPADEGCPAYEPSHMNLVIATPSRMFTVYTLRQVVEHEKFCAMGSGAHYALGALDALSRAIELAGIEEGEGYTAAHAAGNLARQAVRSACQFDIYSYAPVNAMAVLD